MNSNPNKEHTMDAITTRLAAMLDADTLAAESTGDPHAPVARPAAAPRPTQADPGMTRSMGYTGRGPTGRLRNFAAMNDAKLRDVASQVRYEGDDADALAAINAEMQSRGL